ncbi:hypothetical protein DK67_2038 [Brucella suis bv. 3 str. 686]|nr:hypothetical protein DK67_2038 [Brucella suis bv. 3 str. 686]
MRIDIDVEFRRWRDVAALEIAAAHQHDFLDAPGNLRLADQRGSDVGQRSDRAECDGARFFLHQCFNDEINAMLGLKRHGGGGQVIAIEAGLAMNVFSGDKRAHQWADGACKYFCVRLFRHFADRAGIDFCARQRAISCNGGNAENVEFRACKRQQNGDGIVLTGIGIDNDFTGHGGFLMSSLGGYCA